MTISPDVLTMHDRIAMRSANRLKLGLFAANCSSARAVTTVPERWPMTWRENRALAIEADDAGIEFMLPIGRWRGYGGETDFQGTTFETVTWACGLLAATKRITVFGTVHAPLFHPLIAAKEFVTADHIGEGRFGLNVVVGWNEDEFAMLGVEQRAHDTRYAYAREWLEVVKAAWTREDEFDVEGRFLTLRGIRAKPKPFGGTRPIVMNAGASPAGRDFALDLCDAYFTGTSLDTLDAAAATVTAIRAEARARGREIGVYTTGDIVCRPTRREAEEYVRYCLDERADWSVVDAIMAMRGQTTDLDPARYEEARRATAHRLAGFSMVGTPDDVAGTLARVSAAGFDGIAFSFVNFSNEFPFFRQEVLPRLERMGVRQPC
jgi:alkanesulfonate monooxygenase SsuD/methylene tetrahydromethanopterin reductase-like flavin-dependent oxidoreductase (luciferase family)